MNALNQVSGKLRVLGIIGDPIAQVKAPMMANAAIEQQKLVDTLMIPMHVEQNGLADFIHALRVYKNFHGAIVTMPHKQAVVALLDNVLPDAHRIGACNVIRREMDGSLTGTMLDGEGFVAGVKKRGYSVQGQSFFLCGAGGAATAIAFALAANGASTISIYNRTVDKAQTLAEKITHYFPMTKAIATQVAPIEQDVVINATSVGMGDSQHLPFSIEKLKPTSLVCDIVVFPKLTPLLKQAQQRGFAVHYGKAMLENQMDLMLKFMLESR